MAYSVVLGVQYTHMSSEVEFDEGDGFKANAPRIQVSAYGGTPGTVTPTKNATSEAPGASEARGMEGWLIRHQFAKSPQRAQAIMIGVAILNFIIIALIVTFFV